MLLVCVVSFLLLPEECERILPYLRAVDVQVVKLLDELWKGKIFPDDSHDLIFISGRFLM